MSFLRLPFLIPLAAFAPATPSLASTWYVDAVNGNDANTGTSPATAWRSITWAIGHTPASGVQTIRIAAGVYDASVGEGFPLYMRPSMQLVGAPGAVIDGGGTSEPLVWMYTFPGPPTTFGPLTVVRGLSLRNAATGIRLESGSNDVEPTIEDVTIANVYGYGLDLSAFGTGGYFASAGGTYRRVTIRSAAVGVFINCGGDPPPFPGFGSATVVLEDCAVEQCSGSGVDIRAGPVAAVTLTARRTRITDHGASGLRASYFGGVQSGHAALVLEDSLIARNAQDGLEGVTGGTTYGYLHSTLRRTTIGHNGGVGLRAVELAAGQHATTLESCILAGNGDDILQNGSVTASYCNVGDGDFAGSNGNLGLDPAFVDPLGGDFRVRFGSPCIDSADPATPSGTLDLAGHARPLDGDLDTVLRADMGAFEFRPLELVSTGQLGSPLRLEMWGPAGAPTIVHFARSPLVAPQSTPFGQFLLAPTFGVLFSTVAGSGPPQLFQRPIPNNPLLLGQTFSFQSLIDSTSAPQGKAWSNGVEIEIVP